MDLLLAGTIVCDGDRLRVSAELVQAPTGTLLASYSCQTGRDNIFEIQDGLVRRIALNPDLPLAYNLYTQIEADMGNAQGAMVRLLARAATRPNDPELFAGLVQASRSNATTRRPATIWTPPSWPSPDAKPRPPRCSTGAASPASVPAGCAS